MSTLITPPPGHTSHALGATASGVFIMSTVPVCLGICTPQVHVIGDIPGYCEITGRRIWEHKHIVRERGAMRKQVGKESLPLLPLILSWLAFQES